MITFRALLYNVTINEYVYTTPLDCSLGHYTGDVNALISAGDGNEVTTIPSTSFNFNAGTNLGTRIEYEAKVFYVREGIWPVLRFCTTNSADDFYLEWSHVEPQNLTLVVNGNSLVMAKCFQWIDTIGTYIDSETQETSYRYNYYYSNIFVSVGTISDLIDASTIVFNGAFRFGIDPDPNVYTQIGYATYQFSAPSDTIVSANNTYLGTAHWDYYKYGDGPCIAIWSINDGTGHKGPVTIVPIYNNTDLPPYNGRYTPSNTGGPSVVAALGVSVGYRWFGHWQNTAYETPLREIHLPNADASVSIPLILQTIGATIVTFNIPLHAYLNGEISPIEPPSDVDPEDVPPSDEPPSPISPDNPDPYYDPTSDSGSPSYDPTKDPNSPSYNPNQPNTPWRPTTQPGGGDPPIQPIQNPVVVPDVPPAFVTNNSMFTLYNPSATDLNDLANFLWSPQWSVDTFKKIFANPLDCILGLMVMPHLPADVSTKVMAVGNISTGVSIRYFINQFYDFNCGTFKIEEYYASYLDYAPYTKVSIYLPYIGDQQLNTDEVMNKTIGVKYRFDLATGDCVAFITVEGTVLYSFSGNCAARLPISGNNWIGIMPAFTGAIRASSMAPSLTSMAVGAALAVTSMKQDIAHTGAMTGSSGLMGIRTPYLIINRPRQALPRGQNSFTGYPSFMTEQLGSLTGYTEVESCHLEHVPCTGEELEEIEQLLKRGVLF